MYFPQIAVVGAVGVEPTTNGLKGRCSATELRPSRGLLDCSSYGPFRNCDFGMAGELVPKSEDSLHTLRQTCGLRYSGQPRFLNEGVLMACRYSSNGAFINMSTVDTAL